MSMTFDDKCKALVQLGVPFSAKVDYAGKAVRFKRLDGRELPSDAELLVACEQAEEAELVAAEVEKLRAERDSAQQAADVLVARQRLGL